jgi:hypothetical protein
MALSPRIAVVVAGNLRSWAECENTEWMAQYDVFVSTYSCKYNFHPFIQSQLPVHQEEYLTKEQIVEAFTRKGVPVKGVTVSEMQRSEVETSFHPQMKEIYHGYYQYRCVEKGLDLVRAQEAKTKVKYDLIVRTRCDATYSDNRDWLAYLSRDWASKEVLLNRTGHQPCDWILVMPRDMMYQLCSYVIRQYFQPENEMSWQKPPHGLLENFLRTMTVHYATICEIKRPSLQT